MAVSRRTGYGTRPTRFTIAVTRSPLGIDHIAHHMYPRERLVEFALRR